MTTLVLRTSLLAECECALLLQIDFHDAAGLEREAMEGAQLGFSGKQIIHPSQVR